jgi:2-phospho-L-lactate guanylyltransferase
VPGLVAIIPVKPLDEGKSRLASVLAPPERRRLNATFLERSLAVAADFPGPDATIVVSRSDEVLGLAAQRGMLGLHEEPGADLNAAVGQGRRVALARGADEILILPVDLPLVTAAEIRELVENGPPEPRVIIISDRAGTGTNLLLHSPALFARYCFGPGSFRRHCRAAKEAGAAVSAGPHPTISFDIDDPEDLRCWQKCRAAVSEAHRSNQ